MDLIRGWLAYDQLMGVILGSHNAVGIADTGTGEVVASKDMINPSFVAQSFDGRLLYVVSEDQRGPGTVHVLRVDGNQLRVLGIERPSGGEQPCHISIHPDGEFVFVANYGSGSLAVLPIAADGSLADPTCVVQHSGSGVDLPRQLGPHAHQIVTDPSGEWVLACDLGTDAVVIYRLDAANGTLHRHKATNFEPGQGVRHLAFSPAGDRAYVACELSSQLVACLWDATTGTLRPQESISTVSADGGSDERNYPAAVVTSSDGQRIYVTNRGHDSIAVIDAEVFELIGTRSCMGEWPRDAQLSQDGMTLYVANERSGIVVPFDVSQRVPQPSDKPTVEFADATSVLTTA